MDNEAGQTGFFYNQLDKVSRVLDLVFEGITGLKFELIPALVALLKVLQIPCQKDRSSDELYEVPKLSMVFNSFCNLLSFEIKSDKSDEINASIEWENAR
jgi:hypothetical protein